MPLTTERTNFTLDVIGRYTANLWQEAMDSADRSKRSDARPFDAIVIGGGTFGAVLASHLFHADTRHRHRILVLEAGPIALPEHQQNLPMLDTGEVWGVPWNRNSPFPPDNNFPGLAFCVGGRSLFWGGWSPRFIESEMPAALWPEGVRKDLTQSVLPAGKTKESYFDVADRQLGTDVANDFVHGTMHDVLRKRLFGALKGRADGTTRLAGSRGQLAAEPDLEAPLAVQSSSPRGGFFPFNKFSAIPLLIRAARLAQEQSNGDDVKKRLMVVDNVHVIRLERNDRRITRIVTNQGSYDLPEGAQVFLALGTVENTRLALHTLPNAKGLMGRNLMAHLRSNLTVRVDRAAFGGELDPAKFPELQMSALFVKGIHEMSDGTKGHFHIQITASGVGDLGMNSEAEMFKKIPDVDGLDQFRELTDQYIVLTLRGIGEMFGDRENPSPPNRIILDRLGPQGPYDYGTPRALVRLETTPKDLELWKAMDEASTEVAKMFGGGNVQFLVDGVWQNDPTPFEKRHDSLSSTHHEGGTLWMGTDAATSVSDEWGKFHEADNLFALGPCLLPTLGSPNPMLSGVALARRTADHLLTIRPLKTPAKPEEKFRYLFDGTAKSFKEWKFAGQGSFTLVDEAMEAQPGAGLGLLYYATRQFGDFTLRLQVRPHRRDDNSGIFVRFRDPSRPAPDPNNPANLVPYNNKAWVAVRTGFEIQIDDLARGDKSKSPPEPDGLDKSRTGAIYDIPTTNAGPGTQKYQNPGLLKLDDWNDVEIVVQGNTYRVTVNTVESAVFTRGAGPDQYWRGKAPADDPLSGYIGLQCYNDVGTNAGRVAFRNIRIQI